MLEKYDNNEKLDKRDTELQPPLNYPAEKLQATPVKDLVTGQKARILVAVDTVEVMDFKSKDGFFLSIQLHDSTGFISAKIWENTAVLKELIVKDTIMSCEAVIKDYRGEMSATISPESIDIIEPKDVPPGHFIKKSPRNRDDVNNSLKKLIDSVNNEYLKKLLTEVFKGDLLKSFLEAPASKRNHQNYIGGLADHTLNVASICENVCNIYPELNRDIVITGALLHDIGKSWGYFCGASIEVSVEEGLHGHLFSGSNFIKNIMDGDDFELMEKDLKYRIIHIILSHHTKSEWGAIMEPMFPEAHLVASADVMDSDISGFIESYSQSKQATEEEFHYDRMKKKRYYLGSK